MVMQVGMANTSYSGMVHCDKTPEEPYHVDLEKMCLSPSVGMQEVGIIVLTASEDIPPKISIVFYTIVSLQ